MVAQAAARVMAGGRERVAGGPHKAQIGVGELANKRRSRTPARRRARRVFCPQDLAPKAAVRRIPPLPPISIPRMIDSRPANGTVKHETTSSS